MTYPIECPRCERVFRVHGFETWTTCYGCGKKFNPQTNGVHHLLEEDPDSEARP